MNYLFFHSWWWRSLLKAQCSVHEGVYFWAQWEICFIILWLQVHLTIQVFQRCPGFLLLAKCQGQRHRCSSGGTDTHTGFAHQAQRSKLSFHFLTVTLLFIFIFHSDSSVPFTLSPSSSSHPKRWPRDGLHGNRSATGDELECRNITWC